MSAWSDKAIEILNHLSSRINSKLNFEEELSHHSRWDCVSVDKYFFIKKIETLMEFIQNNQFKEDQDFEDKINTLLDRVKTWEDTPLNHLTDASYSSRVVLSFLLLMDDIKECLNNYLTEDTITINRKELIKQNKQLISLSKRIGSSFEKIGDIETKVGNINSASEAADLLPETLESLKEANSDINSLKEDSSTKTAEINTLYEKARDAQKFIANTTKDIEKILKSSERALASATSTGLATAFKNRSQQLEISSRWWVLWLALSLVIALLLGCWRIIDIFELISKPNVSLIAIFINSILSLIVVGAPVWFAWLATKRIGYLFKLIEDYAFKAATSTAYEGFRREASHHGDEMEERVLSSTLDRFDEAPLRFVDDKVTGSPWHELFASTDFKEAIKSTPFVNKIIKLAKENNSTNDLKDKTDKSIKNEEETEESSSTNK